MAPSTNMTIDLVTFYRTEYMLQIYGALLLFVGVPANFVCGIVMGTDRSNHSSTRLLMALLAAVDSAVLLTALLRYWMKLAFAFDIRDTNLFWCLFHTFLVSFSTDAAIAVLCAIAVERFLVVAFPIKSQRLITLKNTILSMIVVSVILILKNSFNFWFRTMQSPHTNRSNFNQSVLIAPSSRILKCKPKEHLDVYVKIFSKFDFVSYSVIPYIILFSTNLYIFIVLRRQHRLMTLHLSKQNQTKNRRRQNRGRQSQNIIKILTALTAVHLVTTIPGTIFNIVSQFFPIHLENVSYGTKRLVSAGLMMLMFTNNAINFLAYLISSRSFRERLVSLVHWKRDKDDKEDSSQVELNKGNHGENLKACTTIENSRTHIQFKTLND